MSSETCYPCALFGRACVLAGDEQPVTTKRKKEHLDVLDAWPEGRWFDVALWLSWPSPFPEHVCYVEASSAFDALLRVLVGGVCFGACVGWLNHLSLCQALCRCG